MAEQQTEVRPFFRILAGAIGVMLLPGVVHGIWLLAHGDYTNGLVLMCVSLFFARAMYRVWKNG